jgi:small subunit ribosomal protein S21
MWFFLGFQNEKPASYRAKATFFGKKRRDVFFGLKMAGFCFRVIARKVFDEIIEGNVVLKLLLTVEAWEGIVYMLKVKSRAGESVQQMIRRFKKLCEKEGLIRDMKRNAYYEKPSEKNRRRMRKAARNVERY